MTIVSQREGIRFESQLESDCAGLAELTCSLFAERAGHPVHAGPDARRPGRDAQ